MFIIKPKVISFDDLTTNVPEDEYSEWNSGTTYASGDYCQVAATHKIYMSLKDTNTNHYPPDNIIGTDPWWVEVGTTNPYRMIDEYVNTATLFDGNIEVQVPFGDCDYVALFGVKGESIDFSVENTEVVQQENVSLLVDYCADWFEYFFEEIEYRKDITFRSNSIRLDNRLNLTVNALDGTSECGLLVVGRSALLGSSQWGVRSEIVDYSRVSTDDWGRTYLAQGNWAKLAKATIFVKTEFADSLYRTIAQYRSTPVVWVLDNRATYSTEYETLVIYGIYRSFDLVFKSLTYSEYELEILGLI